MATMQEWGREIIESFIMRGFSTYGYKGFKVEPVLAVSRNRFPAWPSFRLLFRARQVP
jgi:hypothetical protein